jgi:methylated-DNA-[protein]-cysteine S-methyltransferase
MQIPYGETRSYKEVAEMIGSPKAHRAVGAAVKNNPIPIIIPCHRVIRSNGDIGEYSGGFDIKRKLLQLEGFEI